MKTVNKNYETKIITIVKDFETYEKDKEKLTDEGEQMGRVHLVYDLFSFFRLQESITDITEANFSKYLTSVGKKTSFFLYFNDMINQIKRLTRQGVTKCE